MSQRLLDPDTAALPSESASPTLRAMSAGSPLRWPRYAAVALACGLVFGLCACGQGSGAAGGAGGQAPAAIEVGVVTLQAQPVTLPFELAGRIVAAQSAEIRPQVSGLIRERLFTEGSTVRAGQVLYAIDDASYRAAVTSAEADVAKAQAALEAARLKAKRLNALAAADAGTQQDAEDARSTLGQAEATLQGTQAALATARLNLERTRVTAPISGRVDTSSVTAGALVTASQADALTTVQQIDPIWVDIPQSSVDLLKLRRQLESGAVQAGPLSLTLTLEDSSRYAHAGTLEVRGVKVDSTSGAVTLRAKLPNPEGLLLPGMFVRASLNLARTDAAILVPQAGILRDTRGQAGAWVVGADGKAQRKPVQVAEVINGQWRVTQGLQAGDRLIVEGTGKLREGQIVHAVPAGQASAASAAASASSPTAH